MASRTEQLCPAPDRKLLDLALDTTVELARCFLRLANLPNLALDRLSRYQDALVLTSFWDRARLRRPPLARKSEYAAAIPSRNGVLERQPSRVSS